MSLAKINKSISKIDPRCKLFKGDGHHFDGYHYLVWNDLKANVYKTKSIPVSYTSNIHKAQWLSLAKDFIDMIKEAQNV